jgi:endo-1,4-beta-xylanase
MSSIQGARRAALPLSGVFFSLLFLFGCGLWESDEESSSSSKGRLRHLYKHAPIPIGAALNPAHAFHQTKSLNSRYQDAFTSEFNILVDEWSMKMEEIWASQGDLDFTYADETLNFAKDHDIDVRGHNLVWEENYPDWFQSQSYSTTELSSALETYIKGVIAHTSEVYPGGVKYWDVVNEPMAGEGSGTTYREGKLFDSLGIEYVEKALTWAHEADPDAKLFINEYGIESAGTKVDQLYALVADLKSRGVPIHGIGFQAHSSIAEDNDLEEFGANLDRFIDLGLEVQITELDVRINDDEAGKSSAKLKKQAALFRGIAELCLSRAPDCSALLSWGVTDRFNYLEDADWVTQDEDWPFLLDADFRRKPAYDALYSLVD